MASKFGTWWLKSRVHSWWEKIRSGLGWLWQKVQQYPFITMGSIVLLIAFALAVHWWGWDWTGFNRYTDPELRPNQQYRPEKTLWDWLQLLIVPLVLAVGGFWLSQIQKKTEQRSTADNQRETALQAYIDKMSELLLKEHLGELTVNSELKSEYEQVRNVARVRTITVRNLATTLETNTCSTVCKKILAWLNEIP